VGWDFETDPGLKERLAWCRSFVSERVAVLDACFGNPFDKGDAQAMAIFRRLREEVRRQGWWAPHLPRDEGGQGCSHVQLALLNEILGLSRWAPTVFGYNPHHSGAARLVERYGAEEHKRAYVRPLLEGEIVSCYSMTEPVVGATKTLFRTMAVRDGDGWRIDGEKWFNENAPFAAFFIVIAVTDPAVGPKQGMSCFLVPRDTPGVSVVGESTIGGHMREDGCFGTVRYAGVRVPAVALLGAEGQAYAVVQTLDDSLDLHYAGRGIGQMEAAFSMMCERAVSYETRSGPLRDFQMTKEKIADSRVQIDQFRLLVLHAAWLIDRVGHRGALQAIHAVKTAFPGVLRDVVGRAMHLHGAVGVSNEMPFHKWLAWAEAVAVSDGPTETHKLLLADSVLDLCTPVGTQRPTGHLPTLRDYWADRRLR
jgi:acyl-CoA dehydrogenase